MYKGKKILAIIPARSGSKGIKDKNIKKLMGKPLIGYTIEAAIKSNIFDDIVVSTDSKIYADISIEFGATVPFLRPSKISGDEATTADTIIHSINELNKQYDYFVLLQPTSPLRDEDDIKGCIDMVIDNDLNSAVSVTELDHSLNICNTLDSTLSLENFLKPKDNLRRQDLEKFYRINGAIYISCVTNYLNTLNFYGSRSKAYIMEREKSIDIDTELDFNFVEFLLSKNTSL